MALTHTDTGAHPRQSGFRPRRSPAPPLDPLKANIHVHTLGFGSGRTWVGSGRTPHDSGGAHCLQGLECSSSPTSGTA